jgi:YD repeat-containing protein
VSYGYDQLNRLQTVVNNGAAGATTTYSYDAVGNLSGTALPNGVQITPQLDAMYRVTGLPVTSKPAAAYGYTYGAVGNVLNHTEATGRAASYGYDSVCRLTSESIAGSLYHLSKVNDSHKMLFACQSWTMTREVAHCHSATQWPIAHLQHLPASTFRLQRL